MFHSARIKLTAWYLLIIMLISVTFSVVLYQLLTSEVDRFERQQRARMEHRPLQSVYYEKDGKIYLMSSPQPVAKLELVSEIKQHILVMLIFINCIVIGLSGVFGYILAGRTLAPIKQMMDDQNRFVSDASHELRTPLTALKSAFEVYLRDKKATLTESRHLIDESLADVNKLQSLSESLLLLAQYQQPNGHPPVEKLSLDKIISEAIKKTQPMAKKKGSTIVSEMVPIDMVGDTQRLRELFIILLDNAIKYSADNSKIDIAMKKTTRFIIVNVKDSGIGIAPKDLPHIFERFYRSDRARSKTTGGGYGLGLAIARQIVETHRGSITVRSTLNVGTEFIIRFPLNA